VAEAAGSVEVLAMNHRRSFYVSALAILAIFISQAAYRTPVPCTLRPSNVHHL
jgi:hypothetical protein